MHVHAPRSGAKQRVLSPSDLLAANLGLLNTLAPILYECGLWVDIHSRWSKYTYKRPGVWRMAYGRQFAAGLRLAIEPLAEHEGFQPASS